MHHLLHDPASAYGAPYQRAYTDLAATHRGRPVAEIVPQLRAAAGAALLGFTGADLIEQAQAISSGARYEFRVRVTG
ncbi:hypothetical protein ACFQ7J_02245 [Streptomyces sp. NPDC056501]|uniref:hypothetical protein n=1 Tax=Streptomyces sp. NPDC056501 TaxID=3345841 RepID=UPI00367984AF